MESYDPSFEVVEKIRAEPAETPATDPAELKARVAARVREDSQSRSSPSPEHVVLALAPDLPERLNAVLAEMAGEPAYADIKAIVAPSGRVYLFSEAHLSRADAAERCFAEEAKIAIVEKIRADSELVALTPVSELDALFPSTDPDERAALLAEIQADERFGDIQRVTGPTGEVYLHSEAHLSGNYGRIMMRAQLDDPTVSIVELVRDRSRLPAPTKVTVFDDPVFRLSRQQVDEFLARLDSPERDPALADVRKLVHPTTGAVYLYSDKHLIEEAAFRMMDWDEVGALQNP